MTQRIKTHQLEDFSRSKYSLAIPENWVMRDKDKDYGIDAEVEIFDDKGNATGLVYLVQLKATETSSVSVAKSIDLRIETIKYFHSLDLPVLIVRYSKKDDLFFCKWAHEVDLYYAKKGAKTRRVTFTDEDIWNTESAEKTIKCLKRIRAIKSVTFSLPLPINMETAIESIKGIPRAVFLSTYRRLISEYSNLIVDQPNKEKALILARLDNNDLVVSLGSLNGCTFHNICRCKDEIFVDEVIMHVLLGSAASLVTIGHAETAARVLLDNKIKTQFIDNLQLFASLLPKLMCTSRYGEIVDLVCEVIDSADENTIEAITTVSALAQLHSSSNEKNIKYQKLLEKCLEKDISRGEESLIGISHYNLANHFHSRGMYRRSIQHYLKARKYEPKYLNQSYYFRELASVLFKSGRFFLSSKLYHISLEKGAPEIVKPLYADALMHAGYYQKSHDVFQEYLNSTNDMHDEWILKKICLESLIKHTGVKEQSRKIAKAISIVDFTKAGSPDFERILNRAIELDNLCAIAWCNMGVLESKSEKHVEAASSLILCSLMQPKNIDAWVNATLCCLNIEVGIEILTLTVRTAYYFNKDDYLKILHNELLSRTDDNTLEKISYMMEEIISDIQETSDPIKFRIMHKDGVFRDVITGENF